MPYPDFEFWESERFLSHSDRNSQTSRVPRDFSKVKVPKNLSQLQRFAEKKGPNQDLYMEMYGLFSTAAKGRAVTTREDVRDFCKSWLERPNANPELWSQMHCDGLSVETEERIRKNLAEMLGSVEKIKNDAIISKLFGL